MLLQGTPIIGNFNVVNLIPPTTNATGSSNLASDVVGLKKYFRLDTIINFSTHADAGILTVYKSSDNTANSTQAIAFKYYYSTQASVDTLSTEYSATSTGITLGTVDNALYVFSVTQEDLISSTGGLSGTTDLTHPFTYFTITESTGQTVSAIGLMSGARYTRQPMPTALS
jgi:hypothetical protein